MHLSSTKIGFNGRPFLSNKIRGISRYTLNLVKELHRQHPEVEIHFFCSEVMNNEIKKELQFAFFHEHIVRPKLLWEFWYLPNLLKKLDISIYHSTNNVGVPWLTGIPVLVTIHDDITHAHRKNFFLNSLWGYFNYQIEFYLLRHASSYLTVSQFSKDRIVKNLLLPKEKIKVTYNGVNLPSLDIPTKTLDYYLYVGGLESRKNISLLINALENASKFLNREIELICISDFNSADHDLKEKIKSSNLKIEIINDISDLQLTEYYLNSKMVIIPSLEEGFGLPVAEAMSLKIPLAVSRIEIFEEITLHHCYMFDKLDPSELTSLIVKLELDPRQLSTHVENAYQTAQKYKWEMTAKETFLTYQELLKRN